MRAPNPKRVGGMDCKQSEILIHILVSRKQQVVEIRHVSWDLIVTISFASFLFLTGRRQEPKQ
jgi:hypothetical protein